MDPMQWMGAVRMRIQTADKNTTIIHNRLCPSIDIFGSEKLCGYKKQIHQ